MRKGAPTTPQRRAGDRGADDQVAQLLLGESEHEVVREPRGIPADRFVDAAGRDAVQIGEVCIEEHALTANLDDSASDFGSALRHEDAGHTSHHRLLLEVAICDFRYQRVRPHSEAASQTKRRPSHAGREMAKYDANVATAK